MTVTSPNKVRAALSFHDTVDGLSVPCLKIDVHGVILNANPTAQELLDLHGPIRPSLAAFVGQPQLDRLVARLGELGANRYEVSADLELRCAKQGHYWARLVARSGRDRGTFLITIEPSLVTSPVDLLRGEVQHLHALVRALPEALFVIDGGRITFANPSAATLTGYASETELVGRDFAEFVTNSREELAECFSRGDAATREPFENCLDFRSSVPRITEAWWVPIVFAQRQSVLCVVRDRTVQRQSQADRAHNDRLASIGILASGMAHEINNPLTYVIMNLNDLAATLRDRSQRRQITERRLADMESAVEDALEGAHRVARIVSGLGAYSEHTVNAVDVNSAVEKALQLAGPKLADKIQARTRLGSVLPIQGDEGRMVQVILNLIVNAAQSIERGTGTGTIEISTECRHRDVIIAVSDDGPGIELSIRNHLFEPFITTRRVGEGTGLGLYICYKYATECGGRIEVESEIDRGARFRVIMPAAAQTSSTREPEAERNLVVGPLPQLSMLLIDDEELVRRTLRTSLASRVAVTTAASAREARMLLQDPEKSYDAIVCDLFMPDESGPQLHAWLQENRPELLPRTGFITGGAFTEQARAFIEGIAPPCLQKPFSGEDLLAFVRKIHSASKG